MSHDELLPVPEPYRLRRLSPRDAEALARFYNGLSKASKRAFRPIGVQTDAETCRAIGAENEADPPTRYDLVAWLGDRIVGWCFLWDIRTARPLLGLGIADDHQRRGLGRAMLSSVLDQAAREQLPAVRLTVVQENASAVRLYESFGFTVTGQHIDERDGLAYHEMTCPEPGTHER